jgi:hypothetical protein
MSSIAGACMVYDALLDKVKGPSWTVVRWNQGEHYFERLAQAAKGHEIVLDLMGKLLAVVEIENVTIGIEEPWPFGVVKKMESGWIKQQAEINGAFKGALCRWGYTRMYEVNNQSWKAIIREESGITKPDKWDVKRWAISAYGVEDLPDLIQGKHGKTPKPEKSKAKPIQPDDIYDALGVLAWVEREAELVR